MPHRRKVYFHPTILNTAKSSFEEEVQDRIYVLRLEIKFLENQRTNASDPNLKRIISRRIAELELAIEDLISLA